MKKRISIIGSGNVAWNLVQIFTQKNLDLIGIWARNYSVAIELTKEFNINLFSSIEELKEKSDIIIIAVSDKAIAEVVDKIGNFSGIVAHTSGTVSLDSIKCNIERKSVFYPLQTFSFGKTVDFKEVPIFIETSSEEDYLILENIAKQLTQKIYRVNSEQRLSLHVAAVFAGNYSNLMYIIAEKILNQNNLPFSVLHPLIEEVVRKTVTSNPYDSLTGPARRKDEKTIYLHKEKLNSNFDFKNIYELLANTIKKMY